MKMQKVKDKISDPEGNQSSNPNRRGIKQAKYALIPWTVRVGIVYQRWVDVGGVMLSETQEVVAQLT